MHKKFEINRTNIKGGCQLGRKVVTHNSKSDLPLEHNSWFKNTISVVPDFYCSHSTGLIIWCYFLVSIAHFWKEKIKRLHFFYTTVPFFKGKFFYEKLHFAKTIRRNCNLCYWWSKPNVHALINFRWSKALPFLWCYKKQLCFTNS